VARHPTALRSDDSRPTRDLILDVAERRFAERGFAAVSMREISAEAGLKNQASLYHHFKNKRALYEAVLARGVELLVARIAEGGGKAESRDAVLDHVIDILIEHPHLPRLIQRAGMDDSRQVSRTVSRLLSPLWQQGLAVVSETSSGWAAEQLPYLASGLYHVIFGYFANAPLLATVMKDDPRTAAAIARQRRFVKSAVARLLRAAPETERLPKVRSLRRT
jgi:AcrR family transcriptional regulator